MRDFLLGFDIGGTKCAAILGRANGDGRVEIVERAAFATERGPEPTLARLAELGQQLSLNHGANSLSGIGISCGGPLDSARGVVQSPTNLPGWDEVPVAQWFRDKLGAPALLQNDANACALAEWKWGAGRGCRHMIFLTFGTGMGAGLILNGKLYTGASDLAGEVGHVRLAESGPLGFGKRGSFEGFCSGGGIARLVEERGLRSTAHEVFEAAHRGDALAQSIVETVAHQLGRGLALLVDILNPERIVIGSIFARQRDLLWPTAERVLRDEALPSSVAACRVVPAELGDALGDYAALAIAASATEIS